MYEIAGWLASFRRMWTFNVLLQNFYSFHPVTDCNLQCLLRFPTATYQRDYWQTNLLIYQPTRLGLPGEAGPEYLTGNDLLLQHCTMCTSSLDGFQRTVRLILEMKVIKTLPFKLFIFIFSFCNSVGSSRRVSLKAQFRLRNSESKVLTWPFNLPHLIRTLGSYGATFHWKASRLAVKTRESSGNHSAIIWDPYILLHKRAARTGARASEHPQNQQADHPFATLEILSNRESRQWIFLKRATSRRIIGILSTRIKRLTLHAAICRERTKKNGYCSASSNGLQSVLNTLCSAFDLLTPGVS